MERTEANLSPATREEMGYDSETSKQRDSRVRAVALFSHHLNKDMPKNKLILVFI
jgi:hypothetical protein|tara:strand:- start:4132 stop:4296 length:165 start_codon:yes stop_codon:yes gene_type:complete